MKKRVKKWMFLVGLCIMLLGLSACEYTEEEMETTTSYEDNAEKNAIAYVEQKYGFTPRIVDVEYVTIDSEFEIDFSPEKSGFAFIKVRDTGADKNFWVYSKVTEENTENCWDNYQYEEIETAIKKQLEEQLGVDTKHIDLCYGELVSGRKIGDNKKADKKYGLVHEYFDGNNLAEVLGNAENNKMLACIVADSYIPDLLGCLVGDTMEYGCYTRRADDDLLVQCFGKNLDCLIVNYKDEEALKLAHIQGDVADVTNGTDLNYGMEKMYLYMKEHFYLTWRGQDKKVSSYYFKCEVKEVDGFYYIPIEGTYCNITKVEDSEGALKRRESKAFKQTKIFGDYAIDSDASFLCIYIPTTILDTDKDKSIGYLADKNMVELMDQSQKYVEEEDCWKTDYFMNHLDMIGDWTDSKAEKYLTTKVHLRESHKDYYFQVVMYEED